MRRIMLRKGQDMFVMYLEIGKGQLEVNSVQSNFNVICSQVSARVLVPVVGLKPGS